MGFLYETVLCGKTVKDLGMGTRFVGCTGLVVKVDALGRTILLVIQNTCCFCLLYDFQNISCPVLSIIILGNL
jgi:hypothetical protein